MGLNMPGPKLLDEPHAVHVGDDACDHAGGSDGNDDAQSEGSNDVHEPAPGAPDVADVDAHWADKGPLQFERFGDEVVLYHKLNTQLYIPVVQRAHVGRLTGPFGGKDKAQSQLSWSISCSNKLCGPGCRLVTSNRQLQNDPIHLVRWLLSSHVAGAAEALRGQKGAHKQMWRDLP